MGDPRVGKLAHVLIRYSLKAGAGDIVGLLGSSSSEALILALYEELLQARAFPVVHMVPADLERVFFTSGSPKHFTTVPPTEKAFAQTVDSTIRIFSEQNTQSLSHVQPKRQAQYTRTMKDVNQILREKPWALTVFPTNAYAQNAEMSLPEYEDFLYRAAFLDEPNPVTAWRSFAQSQKHRLAQLHRCDAIRIVSPDTDLTLSVARRRFLSAHGRNNMPCGEIYAAPIENSANGHIVFDLPSFRKGHAVQGIRLVFRSGRVVEASAEKGERVLKDMLEIDHGARRLGEIGMGTNPHITKSTSMLLLDEKIGGTVHLALGFSPPGTGGKNRSAVHWDMIKDLRKDGTLYVNGHPFLKNGAFRLP